MNHFRILFIVFAFLRATIEAQKCGYASCEDTETLLAQRPDTVVVHLLAHTHDDVGWLKTVDQYYYGTKPYIQRASVRLILDSVISALNSNPDRKFTYVEMEFFSKWWSLQANETREIVHRLVNNGQLHFVLAGVSMSDEAAVNYDDSINQLTWGANYLKDLFGDCGKPNVAWQIDPFGHSRDQARVFRDAGFDGVFFQRMDYREKQHRRELKALEHLWLVDPEADVNATHPSALNSKAFFTGVLYDSYCYPATFCFDALCQDELLVDDPASSENNARQRVEMFLRYVEKMSTSFATHNILVPMGCDFTYQNAHQNFLSTDILIKFANSLYEKGLSKYKLIYSTPDCYTLAVNKAFNKHGSKLPVKAGDFFPYVSENDKYWTGFFTSRPAFKYSVRKASNELRLCEQENLRQSSKLIEQINLNPQSARAGLKANTQVVDNLRKAVGLALHHDAITGTAKQAVANDYAKLLHKAAADCQNLIGSANGASFCDTLNISACHQLDPMASAWTSYPMNELLVDIIVSNPLAWALPQTWLKIPIYLSRLTDVANIVLVNNVTGQTVPWQVMPIDYSLTRIPERVRSGVKENYHLFFNTMVPVPAMGNVQFTLSISDDMEGLPARWLNKTLFNSSSVDQAAWSDTREPIRSKPTSFSGRKMTLKGSSSNANGRLMSFTFADDPRHLYHFHGDIQYYKGSNKYGNASGAYIFNPMGPAKPITILTGYAPEVKRRSGPLLEEIHVNYSAWAQLTLRIYKDQQLEVDWTVGPIPDELGYESREVIVRYWIEKDGETRPPKNDQEFFVDSNGRRLIRRVTGRKIYWNLPVEDGELNEWRITGNYYPVNSRAIVKGLFASHNSDPMALAIYTDRAQGVAMLKPGQLEFMVNRRCMLDDSFGVGEALKENGVDGKGLVVRGTHVIRFDWEKHIESNDREVATLVANPPILMFRRRFSQTAIEHQKSILKQRRLRRRLRRRFRIKRNLPQLNREIMHGGLLNPMNPLPSWVNLLALSKWPLENEDEKHLETKQLLLRLEVFNVTEAPACTEFELAHLLTNIKITQTLETTITANQPKIAAIKNRMTWPGEAPEAFPPGNGCFNFYGLEPTPTTVSLSKGEIHTFICDFE